MKKLCCVLFSLILCFSLAGCKEPAPFESNVKAEDDPVNDPVIVWVLEPAKAYEDVKTLEYYYRTDTPYANYLSFKQNGLWGIMNDKLEVIVEPQSTEPAAMCSLGHIHVSVPGTFEEYSLFDGIEIVNGGHGGVMQEIVYNVDDGVMYVVTGDESGMDATPITQYEYMQEEILVFKHVRLYYNEEWMTYEYEDKWLYGYCNTSGEFLTDKQYAYAQPFSRGVAAVMENDRWGYIDTSFNALTGNIYQPCYGAEYYNGEFIEPFFTYSFVDGYGVCMSNTKYGILDKTGTEVLAFEYDKIVPLPGGRALIKIDGKWGIADLKEL
jgi:hypothetical protein